jgi:DNA mismatch repair protein MutS
MLKRLLSISFAFANLCNVHPMLSNNAIQEIPSTQHICNSYLMSKFGIESIEAPITQDTDSDNFIAEMKKQLDPELKSLSPRETQEIAFNIVSHNFAQKNIVIDNSYIDKLEIIGGGENSQQHIFGKIFNNSINTTIGQAYAAFTLCHPITDIATLHNRQNVIKLLATNKTYSHKIDSILKKISDLEVKSLSTWTSKKLVKQEKLNESYFGKWMSKANTYTLPLETFAKKYPLMFSGALNILVNPAIIAYTIHKTAQYSNNGYWQTTKMLTNSILEVIKNPQISGAFKIGAGAYFSIIEGLALFGAYTTYINLKAYAELHNHLQDILIGTATHIKELKQLSSLISKNKELLHYLPSLQPLADFNDASRHSAELNKIINMLDTNTFQKEASFWSVTGRVLAAYELIKQVKDELAPVFIAAGELDMYVALAKLYSAHENKNAHYCMVNFVENSAAPIIDAYNFWNPFINPDVVITNNITFDSSCPNSILTGPNTGGKSTVIKAIMLNVLMAQTFGIAPSENLTITPFTKLSCFMNIADDIATGASLFKSEVMRAKKLLELVQNLKSNEFSFVIIDEIFTGTSPQEGEAAALRFAKHMGTYANNISIIATHYPKMTDLETETNGTFHNHYVEILRNEDGSLNRTFKLKNGPTFFNVAFDILEEEGLFV